MNEECNNGNGAPRSISGSTGFTPQPLLVQLYDLTLIQLSNWRWSWRSMLIMGMVFPLASMIAFGVFARDSGTQALTYVFIGNIVMSLMFENVNKVGSNFSFMKRVGSLTYFASLPIQPVCLVLATVLSFFLLSLPSLAATITGGALIFKLSLSVHPLLVLALPFVCAPLAGIGALIGVMMRTPEEAGNLTLIFIMAMLGLGPIMIPPERLPAVILNLSWLSPATYAASALRQVLLGPVTMRIALDFSVLFFLAVIVLWIVSRKMDWRMQA